MTPSRIPTLRPGAIRRASSGLLKAISEMNPKYRITIRIVSVIAIFHRAAARVWRSVIGSRVEGFRKMHYGGGTRYEAGFRSLCRSEAHSNARGHPGEAVELTEHADTPQ